MGRKVLSIILLLAILGGLVYHAFPDFDAEKGDSTLTEGVITIDAVPEDTIVLWYTDPALTEYINDAALTYRQQSGKDVRMELVEGVDYLENINASSISDFPDIPAPDLYITTHDSLMKAYLAGLASPILDKNETVCENNFPTTALHAIACDGKSVAYPLYFETNFFLYNKTYMSAIAQNRIESEIDKAEGQQAQEDSDNKSDAEKKEEALKTNEEAEKLAQKEKQEEEEKANAETDNSEDANNENDDNTTDESSDEAIDDEDGEPYGDEDNIADQEVLERLATMIPSKISDITTFANNYDAPEAVEAVFKWDVTDIFYNYFFVGNYMQVGGEDGDNNSIFNLYNQQAVECLKSYQDMNQYFTMETDDDYNSILQQFIDGKLVFTIATTDAFAKIQEAQLNGDFNFDYGVAIIPDVSDLLQSRGLSVTDVIAVNGYSTKKEAANEFAAILSYDSADLLYMKAGKLACKREVPYENAEITNVMTEYQKSMPLPKMIETSNFWLQLEIAFSKVWAGEDPDTVLKDLSDTMGGQIEQITYSIPVQESIGAGVQTFFTK